MDKEVLEVVLKNSLRKSSVKRIIDIKSEPAVPKGENYSSTVLKLTAKVVLGNGRIATKSFIVKKVNPGRTADQLKIDLSLFKWEASVYTNILKEMDYLMEEFQDTEGPIWCKFIHYNHVDPIIVLEDLKESGFRTVKRTEMQDIEHARLVLRSLGRYHAMAKVLEMRGIISIDSYNPYACLYDEFLIKATSYGGNQCLINGIREFWGKEWAETADELSKITFEEYLRRTKISGTFDDDTFKCLNHGDCWNTNMMFKYNWEGRPIKVRFIDYQQPHYNSPCVDLTYYLYTSIKPEVRRQNYRSLIELYHETLTTSLERFGYVGSKPSLGDIEKNMERLSFFGITFFMGCCPIMISTRTDAMDFDKLMETGGKEGINLSIYNEDGIIEKMGKDIKKLLQLIRCD